MQVWVALYAYSAIRHFLLPGKRLRCPNVRMNGPDAMPDLSELFRLSLHPAELVLRGTLIYLGLVLVFRFVLRRDVGSLGVPDVLFIVLVADASQNALSGEYTSIADGILLVGTLVVWNVALDWLAYRSPVVRRFIEPPSLPIIAEGSRPSQESGHSTNLSSLKRRYSSRHAHASVAA